VQKVVALVEVAEVAWVSGSRADVANSSAESEGGLMAQRVLVSSWDGDMAHGNWVVGCPLVVGVQRPLVMRVGRVKGGGQHEVRMMRIKNKE
jgi:hypothetical protein